MLNNIAKLALGAVSAAALLAVPAGAEEEGLSLQMQAITTMDRCLEVSDTCGEAISNAAGVLVFPEVLKVDLIVGAAGGNGVLFVDNMATAYYDIGRASVGLQAGADEMAMVYVFKTQESLNKLLDGGEFEVGAEAGVTVIKANADAVVETGDPAIYVFDADGLNAELDVNALRIWPDSENAG